MEWAVVPMRKVRLNGLSVQLAVPVREFRLNGLCAASSYEGR